MAGTPEARGDRAARSSIPEQPVPVGPDAPILAVMSTARAMRHLAPDPVPDELIRSVLEAATWAPTPGNFQPVRYVVVTDRDTIGRLAGVWRRVVDDWRLLEDASGVGDLSNPSERRTRESGDYQRDHFAETPAVVVVCIDTRHIEARARSNLSVLRTVARRVGLQRAIGLARRASILRARGEGAAVFPAVENLLLAARAHGLAACLTQWHLLAEDEFKRILGIPNDVTTWAVVPIGWPLKRFGPVKRLPVDEVIHRDRW